MQLKIFRVGNEGIEDFLRNNRFPTDLGFPQSSTQPLSTNIEFPLSAYALHATLEIGEPSNNVRLNFSETVHLTHLRPQIAQTTRSTTAILSSDITSRWQM